MSAGGRCMPTAYWIAAAVMTAGLTWTLYFAHTLPNASFRPQMFIAVAIAVPFFVVIFRYFTGTERRSLDDARIRVDHVNAVLKQVAALTGGEFRESPGYANATVSGEILPTYGMAAVPCGPLQAKVTESNGYGPDTETLEHVPEIHVELPDGAQWLFPRLARLSYVLVSPSSDFDAPGTFATAFGGVDAKRVAPPVRRTLLELATAAVLIELRTRELLVVLARPGETSLLQRFRGPNPTTIIHPAEQLVDFARKACAAASMLMQTAGGDPKASPQPPAQ